MTMLGHKNIKIRFIVSWDRQVTPYR